jgi:hypothetical protein
MLLWALVISTLVALKWCDAAMPSPFYRELYVTNPVMTGNDVLIAQTLLKRDAAVDPKFVASGKFSSDSGKATSDFQAANNLPATGILDSASAQALLDLHCVDLFSDCGFTAPSWVYLQKSPIHVNNNRSVETTSTLFDANNKVLLKFKTRTHGHRADGTDEPWPDYGNGDEGLNQFTSNGEISHVPSRIRLLPLMGSC